SLKGRYITAEDVGTSVEDMDYVHMETEYVAGIAGRSGDPSPVTAYGVYRGIKACARERYGGDSLSGLTIAVQGLGHVGYHLCSHLAEEGVKLVVTDIDEERVARVVRDSGATAVAQEEIYGGDRELFEPGALGSVINDEPIPRFRCEIIAGAANSQHAEALDGDELVRRGILYAPDYVITAGRLISVSG